VQENVRGFEVAVDDVVLRQVKQTVVHVLDDGVGLGLVEHLFHLEPVFEVSLVAELSDDVAVTIAGEYLEAFEHARVVKFLQDLNLLEEKFF